MTDKSKVIRRIHENDSVLSIAADRVAAKKWVTGNRAEAQADATIEVGGTVFNVSDFTTSDNVITAQLSKNSVLRVTGDVSRSGIEASYKSANGLLSRIRRYFKPNEVSDTADLFKKAYLRSKNQK